MSGYTGYLLHKWGLQIVGRKEDAQKLRVDRAIARAREVGEKIAAGEAEHHSHLICGPLNDFLKRRLEKGIAEISRDFNERGLGFDLFIYRTSKPENNFREIKILPKNEPMLGGCL